MAKPTYIIVDNEVVYTEPFVIGQPKSPVNNLEEAMRIASHIITPVIDFGHSVEALGQAFGGGLHIVTRDSSPKQYDLFD